MVLVAGAGVEQQVKGQGAEEWVGRVAGEGLDLEVRVRVDFEVRGRELRVEGGGSASCMCGFWKSGVSTFALHTAR